LTLERVRVYTSGPTFGHCAFVDLSHEKKTSFELSKESLPALLANSNDEKETLGGLLWKAGRDA